MNSVFGRFSHIHFVGIGGIGMSGIAEVLHNMGFTVSGSDISENANVKMLRDMGIKISIGIIYTASLYSAPNNSIIILRTVNSPIPNKKKINER